MMKEETPNAEILLAIAKTQMPFGRFKGRLLIDLPEPYLVWLANQGFPQGNIGKMLSIVYEVKVNGLEYLFEPLRRPVIMEGDRYLRIGP